MHVKELSFPQLQKQALILSLSPLIRVEEALGAARVLQVDWQSSKVVMFRSSHFSVIMTGAGAGFGLVHVNVFSAGRPFSMSLFEA